MPLISKEKSTTKRFKISQAQEYMLGAVLGAAVVFGITLALFVHFIQQISFNGSVLEAEDQAIVAYSNTIKTTGVCISPEGEVYTDEEIAACNPDSIKVSQIPNTLRANILHNLALNSSLNSVPKEADAACINPDSRDRHSYTGEELQAIYDDAAASGNADELQTASRLIRSCSALRIIPDALPAFRNEEALLASLNKLFIESGWQPESLSPGGTSNDTLNNNLKAFSVNLSVDANTSITMNVLHNIERSIREFDIERATIKWSGIDTLTLNASATAYYMDESTIVQGTKTLKPGENK